MRTNDYFVHINTMHKTNYHPQHPQNQHFNEYLLDINKTEIPTDKGVNSYTMEEAKIQN